jgi:2-dehydro-3-deoxy-D-arabinonate dehydratase
MKLLQFHLPGQGARVGVLEGDRVVDLTAADPGLRTTLDVLNRSIAQGCAMDDIVRAARPGASQTFAYADLDAPPDASRPHLDMPIHAPEVWGFGVTYKRSAVDRDTDSASDIYTRVYVNPRPEVFFKATPPRCVGPNGYICVRSDSDLTAVEPELAFVIGADGRIVGYTACNDVSAWDIERENPLYLPQSKVYLGCCALGPVLVTAEELPDPYNISISCRIFKKGAVAFEGKVHSSQINRRFEDLVACLTRDNPVPVGTAVTTGTGIMPPNDLALTDGDRVDIEIEGIGLLSNPVRKL